MNTGKSDCATPANFPEIVSLFSVFPSFVEPFVEGLESTGSVGAGVGFGAGLGPGEESRGVAMTYPSSGLSSAEIDASLELF